MKIANIRATIVAIPNEKLMIEYAVRKMNIISSVTKNIAIKMTIIRIPNPQYPNENIIKYLSKLMKM